MFKPSRSPLALARALCLTTLSCGGGGPETPPSEAPPTASPAPPPAPLPSSHTRIDGQAFPDKVIALTWDDGPDRSTLELAGYLKTRRVSATFFVVSAWIDGVSEEPGEGKGVFESGYTYLPILGDLVALGHRVANHTLNHVVLREAAGAALIDRELRENQQNLDPFLMNELRLFRAPGGGWGSFGRAIVDSDPYLTQMVGPVAWDVDRKDWDESLHCRSPRGIFECERAGPGGTERMKASVVAARYVAAIDSARHGIVLLHDRVGHVGSTYGLDVARAMVPQLQARGYVFAAPVLRFSPLLLRARGMRWDPGSVRLGDINGDGRADACGRDAAGVSCAISISLQSKEVGTDRLPRTMFRAVRSGATLVAPPGSIHLADLDGDGQLDLCVSRSEGIDCAAWSASGALGAPQRRSSRNDDGSSVRFADIDGDGKADACSPNAQGVTCARNVGRRLETAQSWLTDMSDAHGWSLPRHAATVQLADVDGDGKADVCGRSPVGVVCARSTGNGFAKLETWSTDVDFLGDGALRFGDINGDGREDVCAQGSQGLACAFSTGRGFTKCSVWLERARTDAQGWEDPALAATIQLGDVNGDGRADVCGYGREGLVCGLAP